MKIKKQRLAIVCLTTWPAMIFWGWYFFGVDGVLLYGTIGSISLLLFCLMLARWSGVSWFDRSKFLVAIACSLIAIGCMTHVYCSCGMHLSQGVKRSVSRLESQLKEDSRFASISLECWAGKSGEVTINTAGNVATKNDFDALQLTLDQYQEWCIVWNVRVINRE